MLCSLIAFSNHRQIEANEKDWKTWYESEKPEAEEIPCSYSNTLDSFRKLLLIRSWSPDRTISQAKKYVEGNASEALPVVACFGSLSSANSYFVQNLSGRNMVKCKS